MTRIETVNKMTMYLYDDSVARGGMGINVADLSLAIAEVQLHNALVDLLLPANLQLNIKSLVLVE
jgi:hypothetical protein